MMARRRGDPVPAEPLNRTGPGGLVSSSPVRVCWRDRTVIDKPGDAMRGMEMDRRRKLVVLFWALALAGACLVGRSGRGSAWDSDAPGVAPPRAAQTAPDGWVAGAPRDEIRPEFAHQPHGATDGQACLIIKADHREGLDGFWK